MFICAPEAPRKIIPEVLLEKRSANRKLTRKQKTPTILAVMERKTWKSFPQGVPRKPNWGKLSSGKAAFFSMIDPH
jgi:hypothetical protein